MIFLKENAYFQENLAKKYVEFRQTMREKPMFFGTFDFEGISTGSREGFGIPKTWIFALFRCFFEANFEGTDFELLYGAQKK